MTTPSTSSASPAARFDSSADPLKDKRILIVDDDPDIQTTISAVFESTGAQLDVAENGNKAVDLYEAKKHDLVILDMMLPGRSGFLVLEKLKARKPKNAKPYVIMVTGNQGGRHKLYAEAQGASAYFTKPVPLQKLLAEATRLLSLPTPPAK